MDIVGDRIVNLAEFASQNPGLAIGILLIVCVAICVVVNTITDIFTRPQECDCPCKKVDSAVKRIEDLKQTDRFESLKTEREYPQ